MRLFTMQSLAAALLVIPAHTTELLVVRPQSKLWVERSSARYRPLTGEQP